jgi:hypothetical protein
MISYLPSFFLDTVTPLVAHSSAIHKLVLLVQQNPHPCSITDIGKVPNTLFVIWRCLGDVQCGGVGILRGGGVFVVKLDANGIVPGGVGYAAQMHG